MKHSSKTSYFLVGQIFSWSIHQRLEGKTLCSLTEGDVDILVRNTSARWQGQGTVWRHILWARETGWFPLSLGWKIYKVAELQLPGVGEAAGEAGELDRTREGGEGGELCLAEGEEEGRDEISGHGLFTLQSSLSAMVRMSECQPNISFLFLGTNCGDVWCLVLLQQRTSQPQS